MDFDTLPPSGNRKLEKLKEQIRKHSKRPLPPEVMAKVRAENRRQKLLTYLLVVLLGIALLVIASIIDAQISPEQTEEPSIPSQASDIIQSWGDAPIEIVSLATDGPPTATPVTPTATPPPTATPEKVLRFLISVELTRVSGPCEYCTDLEKQSRQRMAAALLTETQSWITTTPLPTATLEPPPTLKVSFITVTPDHVEISWSNDEPTAPAEPGVIKPAAVRVLTQNPRPTEDMHILFVRMTLHPLDLVLATATPVPPTPPPILIPVIMAPDDFTPEPTPWGDSHTYIATPFDDTIPRTPWLADQGGYGINPEDLGYIKTGPDPGHVSPTNLLDKYECASDPVFSSCWRGLGCQRDSQLFTEGKLDEKCDCDNPKLQECVDESLAPWVATANFQLTMDPTWTAEAKATGTKQAKVRATQRESDERWMPVINPVPPHRTEIPGNKGTWSGACRSEARLIRSLEMSGTNMQQAKTEWRSRCGNPCQVFDGRNNCLF